MYTFIVTNMEELGHWQVIDYYCNRGRMENFIGEGKQGFDFAVVSRLNEVLAAFPSPNSIDKQEPYLI